MHDTHTCGERSATRVLDAQGRRAIGTSRGAPSGDVFARAAVGWLPQASPEGDGPMGATTAPPRMTHLTAVAVCGRKALPLTSHVVAQRFCLAATVARAHLCAQTSHGLYRGLIPSLGFACHPPVSASFCLCTRLPSARSLDAMGCNERERTRDRCLLPSPICCARACFDARHHHRTATLAQPMSKEYRSDVHVCKFGHVPPGAAQEKNTFRIDIEPGLVDHPVQHAVRPRCVHVVGMAGRRHR